MGGARAHYYHNYAFRTIHWQLQKETALLMGPPMSKAIIAAHDQSPNTCEPP